MPQINLITLASWALTGAILSGCVARTIPKDQIEIGINSRNVSSEVLNIPKVSPLIDIVVTNSVVKAHVEEKIVAAEDADIFQVYRQNISTGVKESDYLVTRQQYLVTPHDIKIPVYIVNSSDRAFDLTGAVIRAVSINEGVKVSCPQDVTNTKRLAPGERMSFDVIVEAMENIRDGDLINVTIFELPKEMSNAGEVTDRVTIKFSVKLITEDSKIEIKKYALVEHRTYPGEEPQDLMPFLKPRPMVGR